MALSQFWKIFLSSVLFSDAARKPHRPGEQAASTLTQKEANQTTEKIVLGGGLHSYLKDDLCKGKTWGPSGSISSVSGQPLSLDCPKAERAAGCSCCGPEQSLCDGQMCKTFTYDECAAKCASVGARLCTEQEVGSGKTWGTGCWYSYMHVWTGPQANIVGETIFGERKYSVYIIDKSSSMNSVDSGKTTSRNTAAVQDLTTALRALSTADEFSVVRFNSIADAAFTTVLKPASAANVDAAVDFFSKPANSTTCYSCALETAWQITGDVTRIVLMTDGEPTAGITSTDALVDLVRTNGRKIPIDTVLFAADSIQAQTVMQAIADESGGTYRKV